MGDVETKTSLGKHKYEVCLIPNTDKINIVNSPNGMGTLPDPFRGVAYTINKCHSNKGVAHKTEKL